MKNLYENDAITSRISTVTRGAELECVPYANRLISEFRRFCPRSAGRRTPGSRMLALGVALNARYLACIARVAASGRAIDDVVPAEHALKVIGDDGKSVSVAAEGLGEFLKGNTGA